MPSPTPSPATWNNFPQTFTWLPRAQTSPLWRDPLTQPALLHRHVLLRTVLYVFTGLTFSCPTREGAGVPLASGRASCTEEVLRECQ